MRKLSFIFLALVLALSMLPVAAVSAPAQAAKPIIAVFPIPPYVKTAPMIGGTVNDTDGQTIQYVHLQLTCLTNGTQWTGTAWVATPPPQWLVTNAQDGAFDSSEEIWLYLASIPKYATGMQYEISVVKTEDVHPEVQIVNPGIKFWYDTQPPAIGVDSPPATADDLDEISGSASDATSPIIGVKVQIRRGVDNQYLNLDSNIWQDCPAWNDADAEDGQFNEKSESWELDTSGIPWYDGRTYSIWAMTSDAAGNSVVSAPAKQYTCDRYHGTGLSLEIDMNGAEVPYFTNDADPDIRGSASSIVARFVARVMIKLERDDNHWWNGTGWEGGLPYLPQFVDAQALDGNFNSNIEDWWNDSTTIDWSGPGVNNSYKVTAMAQDSAVTPEEAYDTEQFTIDLTPPAANVDAIPPTGPAPASIEGSASDTAPGRVASVQVQLRKGAAPPYDYWNGMAWQNNVSWLYSMVTVDIYPSYDWVLNTYPLWEVGQTYNVSARAVDAAGNCGAIASEVFVCTAVPVYVPPTPTPTATATETVTPEPGEETPTPTATGNATSNATSTPGTTPTPTPQVIIDVATNKVDAGGDFIARVRLNGVENFDNAQYRIEYDPLVIEVTDVTDGIKGTSVVPVSSWALVPAAEQGVVSVVNDVPGATGLSGDLILATIDFDVVGAAGTDSDIDFIKAHCKLFDNGTPNATEIDAGWKDDSVEVKAVTPTATPTGNATSNATATPTATPTPGDEDGGSPGWLWPLVGILIVLTLVFIGLALYKTGYLAKLGGMWGGSEEDFLVDDMNDEDLYDAMYGGEEEEEL